MSVIGILVFANLIGVFITHHYIEKYNPKLKEQIGDFAFAGFFGTWTLFTYTLGFLFLGSSNFPNRIKSILCLVAFTQWAMIVFLTVEFFQ